MTRVKTKTNEVAGKAGRSDAGRKESEIQRQSLRRMLDRQGANFTCQRATVFEYLRKTNRHPTAEDVYVAVKKELPRISLATVYKNLEALVACGAASKLAVGESSARYEIRTDSHYHSRCIKCGLIIDITPAAREQLAKLIQAPSGFKVQDYRIELIGYCKSCK